MRSHFQCLHISKLYMCYAVAGIQKQLTGGDIWQITSNVINFFSCSMQYRCIAVCDSRYRSLYRRRVLLVTRVADCTFHDESYLSLAAKGLRSTS